MPVPKDFLMGYYHGGPELEGGIVPLASFSRAPFSEQLTNEVDFTCECSEMGTHEPTSNHVWL